MQQSEVVSLKRLLEKRYVEILCYPCYEPKEAERRLRELRKLRVKALEFAGEKKAFDVYVLGKGYVGIVVTAYTDKVKGALKIRRVDANRAGMQHEAEMLKRANDAGIGPKLLGVTDNFLLTEFIEGTLLPKWIGILKPPGRKTRINKVLLDVLEQCWRLDREGLDHGELSHAPKHIIVGTNDAPYIVDFETASINRKVSNVTSICQYLFIGSQLARTMRKKQGNVDAKTLIHTLKAYKQRQIRENFEEVLVACGLKTSTQLGKSK